MQLIKIELNGFKSFANKTELTIPQGVTTIVGPNGSGKSNISDAVRWVLGEQSAKSLRGGKMEDVIFAGTQNRKKVGYAEVTLLIENDKKELPVDFNEVEVTRRLYRSGESQYYINQTACRLKDVQELFMDTGIGKDGYSIISQGKIEEVLSTKSENRRGLFEEAAGIVKYKTRKIEAEKKLDDARENISRITDILNEITSKLEPLESQSKVAKRFLDLREKIKYAEVNVFLDNVEKNTAKIKEYQNLLNAAKESLNLETEKINISEAQKVEIKEQIEKYSIQIEVLNEEFFNMKEEFSNLKLKVETDLEKVNLNNERIEKTKEEVRESLEKIDEAQGHIDKRVVKIADLEKNKLSFEKQMQEAKEEYDQIAQNMDKDQAAVEILKEEINQINEKTVENQTNIKSLENEIKDSEKRSLALENAIKNKISEQDALTIDMEGHNFEIAKANREYLKLENSLEEKNKIVLEKENEVKEILELKNKFTQDINNKTHEKDMLIAMENQNEGYARSVKSVLEYTKEDSKVYGTVASLFETDEKYEVAIESALGGLMQNIVVQDDNSAKRCIEYLKENKLGKATFYPIESIRVKDIEINKKAKTVEGYIGEAIDLIKFNSKFDKIMKLVLGNIVIADNIENAIKIAKTISYSSKIITLDGEIISQVGSMSGGSNQAKTSGIVGRTKKIETLKNQINAMQNDLVSLEEKYTLKEQELNTLVEENKNLQEEFTNVKIQKASLEQKSESFNIKMNSIKESKLSLLAEKEKLAEKIELNRNNIMELESEITLKEEEKSEKKVKVDDYARFNKDKSDKMDELNETIVNLKISLSSFDESKDSLDQMIHMYENIITDSQNNIAKKKEEMDKLALENKEYVEAKENFGIVTLDYEEKISKKEQEIKEIKDKKDSLSKDIDKIDSEFKDSNKQITLMQEEKSRLENSIEKIEAEIENFKNRMWDEYEITTSKAREIMEVSEEKIILLKSENPDLKKFVSNLKLEIKSMGTVNVGAIEEYKEVKERHEFLSTQKTDLEYTEEKLLKLIDNMTSIMKKQFKAQFQIINENFNRVFNNLFEGGSANLTLTDESNILDCGIEIEVEPPGKKLQNMTLLSGGERALTAIALLFAILQMKSPPFCILDEIEAALDDVNVQRFANYIKKYSDETQFIVITHRKGTMEAAKTVYGVTMQEYGISNVVSMKMK